MAGQLPGRRVLARPEGDSPIWWDALVQIERNHNSRKGTPAKEQLEALRSELNELFAEPEDPSKYFEDFNREEDRKDTLFRHHMLTSDFGFKVKFRLLKWATGASDFAVLRELLGRQK